MMQVHHCARVFGNVFDDLLKQGYPGAIILHGIAEEMSYSPAYVTAQLKMLIDHSINERQKEFNDAAKPDNAISDDDFLKEITDLVEKISKETDKIGKEIRAVTQQNNK